MRNFTLKIMRALARMVIRRFVGPPLADLVSHRNFMQKIGRFVACNMVDGDYLEFGCYRGESLIQAYWALEDHINAMIALDIGGQNSVMLAAQRKELWSAMRFVAFDSFQGLPPLSDEDRNSDEFEEGMYACSVDDFVHNVTDAGVPKERLVTIKGWFHETCTQGTIGRYGLRKAAIIWIDGDLYSSTVDVLNFIVDLLQDGTIIVFDDWFSYRGNPNQGEQRAFNEWIARDDIAKKFSFQEYQRGAWKRMSFIASLRVD